MPRAALQLLATAALGLGLAAGLAFADSQGRHSEDRHQQPAATQPAGQPATQPATQPHKHAERDRERDRDRHRDHRRNAARQRIHQQLFGNLGLTDEQQAQVHGVLQQARQRRHAWWREHKDQLRQLRVQMRDAHKGEDKEQAKALREQLHELMETAPHPGDVREPLQAILSDAQWEQLQTNWEEFRQKRRGRKDRHQDAPDARQDKQKAPEDSDGSNPQPKPKEEQPNDDQAPREG